MMAALYTGTITAIAYLEATDQEVTTPLGTFTVSVPIDALVTTFEVKGAAIVDLHCSPDAVGNRMAVYAIDDIVAAVESLVREAVFGFDPNLAPPPDPDGDQNAATGGLDPRIDILWTPEASAQATAVLDPLAERIYAARDSFLPPAAPPPPV